MNISERRQYTRRQTEVGVSIFIKEETIPATVVDLCEGGFGLNCQRAFFPGTEIYLKLDDIDDFGIYGTVKWAFLQNTGNEISYRLGIQVERIAALPADGAQQTIDRTEFMKKIMPETIM
ncbi:MAG: PilZ domain-containing protein [Desulfobacterales bacterium]|nr:PilZ domain-containing protein [Desulfobacterales bacterium]